MGHFGPDRRIIVETVQRLVARGNLVVTAGTLRYGFREKEAFALFMSGCQGYLDRLYVEVCMGP